MDASSGTGGLVILSASLRRATIVLTNQEGALTMEVSIRKMGNSQGVLIPKPILAQVGLEGAADL